MDSRIRQIDPHRLWDANRDYIERIERAGVNLVYDATLDSLFMEFGSPREALSEYVIDNVMVRIEPDTLEIVGFEILDLFSDFLPNNRLFREAIIDLAIEEGKDSVVALTESRFKPYKDLIEAMMAQVVHSASSA